MRSLSTYYLRNSCARVHLNFSERSLAALFCGMFQERDGWTYVFVAMFVT